MKTYCHLVFIVGSVLCIEHDFKGFDDTILFRINWPGKLENFVETRVKTEQKDLLQVTTSFSEQYACHLPILHSKGTSSSEDYTGPTPLELLKPIFSQKICSYRLEGYWSYEVCHGRHARQYHEDREGKQPKTHEYYLGRWPTEQYTKFLEELSTAYDPNKELMTTKVEGYTLPYVELVMGDGTFCEISGQPRKTRILYVCYTHGKHEVYSMKETVSCEYEIVILSGLLCDHPKFKPQVLEENSIDCFAMGDTPKKPRNLLQFEVESLRMNHQSIRLGHNENDAKDVLAVLKVEKIDKDGETHLKFELHPLTDDSGPSENKLSSIESKLAPVNDDSPVRAFLNGDDCLHGGTGWWKYEFCFGKHVTQYHVERNGEKTTLTLGKFDEEAHLNWIKDNRGKAPKPIEERKSVSHFYSNGDVCDETGKPRQTEVKLKCLENSSSPAQVSLYLLEPRTCNYILGVESPLICKILPLADENGLIQMNHEDISKETKKND
ncbi:endoplasmic reticulum lectin 1 isoform X1 [Leptidea sinapis]|uniref:endoplasmic reticulum lectin 1 isoform X1 n=1 Tax=Leptidea sinapis TaxID=189913 RepID=UPI00213024F8|nr:endoplasmic reticulum lectin 1 isoform X1 [Leptidea sinapis]